MHASFLSASLQFPPLSLAAIKWVIAAGTFHFPLPFLLVPPLPLLLLLLPALLLLVVVDNDPPAGHDLDVEGGGRLVGTAAGGRRGNVGHGGTSASPDGTILWMCCFLLLYKRRFQKRQLNSLWKKNFYSLKVSCCRALKRNDSDRPIPARNFPLSRDGVYVSGVRVTWLARSHTWNTTERQAGPLDVNCHPLSAPWEMRKRKGEKEPSPFFYPSASYANKVSPPGVWPVTGSNQGKFEDVCKKRA